MVSPVVANEDALTTLRANVPLGVMVRPFDGMFVQDTLADPDERLSKRTAAHSLPCSEPVGAPDHGVEQQRCMLHQPSDHGVVHWDLPVNPLLKAQLDRSEKSSQ